MSISLMSLAWKSTFTQGKKMVLLALCDNANDQGECFPSISMLTEKCSMSERSIFKHIDALEKDGAIRRENRLGRSTIYHINPCKFCTPADSAPLQILHPTPADSAPPPLQILHPTPADSAPITISEPSGEPVNIKNIGANASQKKFTKPTLDEISDYCFARGNSVSPGRFYDYYESNGWKVGKNPMKDWQASIRTWEHSTTTATTAQPRASPVYTDIGQKRKEAIDKLTGRYKENVQGNQRERDITSQCTRIG